jgi:hypothetical protein
LENLQPTRFAQWGERGPLCGALWDWSGATPMGHPLRTV